MRYGFIGSNAWEFALASVAVSYAATGSQGTWRIVLGGVAPTPWRLENAERSLGSGNPTRATIDEVLRIAAQEAGPPQYNRYKAPLVQKLLNESLTEMMR